jgi:hypothetical protein
LYHQNPSKVTSYSTDKSPGKRLASTRLLKKGQHTKSEKIKKQEKGPIKLNGNKSAVWLLETMCPVAFHSVMNFHLASLS